MTSAVRTVAPETTPVSLSDVKAHCRVDDTDSDIALNALLAAATDHLDGPNGLLGKCMVEQTWRQDFDGFGDCMRLAVGPAASITSVTYYDADNAQQTLSADVYALRTSDLEAFVDLKPDQEWPESYERDDALSVTFVAGVAVEDVPPSLKAAVLMLVSHWNENREGSGDIPASVKQLVGLRREVFV